jgi:hypothetical protein
MQERRQKLEVRMEKARGKPGFVFNYTEATEFSLF